MSITDPVLINEMAAKFHAEQKAAAQAAPAPAPEAPKEEPKVEAPAEAASGEPEKVESKESAQESAQSEPKKDPMASRFAALTRIEKEIRAREQEVERRASAAAERERLAEQRAKAAEEREARLAGIKQSPYKLLKEQGLTLQDVINDSLNQYEAPKEDPVAELAKKLEALEKAPNSKVEALEKQVSDLINELQDREYKTAITEVEQNITETVVSAPEKYELMSAYGDEAIDLAKGVIREYFKKTHEETGAGKLLSYEEACDIVEKHYEDESLERVLKTKKARSRLGVTDQTAAPKEAPKPSSVKEAPKPHTLTAKAATAASEVKVDVNKLDRDEAIAFLTKKHGFK